MLDKLKAKFKDLAERYQTIWGIKKPMLESKPENALKGAYVQVQMAVNDYRNAKDATQKQTAAATLQTRVQAWNNAYQAASDADKQQFKAQNESVVKIGQQLAQTQTAAPTPTPAGASNELSGSVGRDAANAEADVRKVQELLKKHGYNVDVDGIIGNQTITAIEQFQQAKLGEHDGVIQPNKGTWRALLAAPSQDTSANNSAPQTTPDTTGGSYSYYNHPNYTNVKLTYDGKTAYTLNTAADRLIRSALAKAGIFSATITSTKRTYADQARIMKEEVTLAQVAQWYGSDVADAVRSKDKASLEQWIRKNRPNISNHLSGIALDVVVSNRSAYKKVMDELVPMKGSGVKYHLPEDHGVEHTEFTFPVTNIKD